MACCLTAPSHHLNQCWLVISEVLWQFWQEMDKIFDLNIYIYKSLKFCLHLNVFTYIVHVAGCPLVENNHIGVGAECAKMPRRLEFHPCVIHVDPKTSWLHLWKKRNIPIFHIKCTFVNSLGPGRSECDSKNGIFNLVLLIGIFRSAHDNSFWWMPQIFTDDKSTLVQVMAWCRQAASHYLSQCWLRSLSPYGVTRPQWVKSGVVIKLGWITNSLRLSDTKWHWDLGQDWFSQRPGAWWHQAITWTNVDKSSVRSCGIHLKVISHVYILDRSLKMSNARSQVHLSGGEELIVLTLDWCR